ncbi:RNA polymerase sigma factor [Nostocoides australiense]|uniref:RNA polymerase sigma factor n=1 Tax=Nostocoides australiense Ben110 TaxID=1193182 RepID=W6K4R8_9MICO|nr:sigma-70 family RNA polymerase sigma factor [Tetrasphaera australiensis]CCH75489.1 RNA polymerase sigma factor [Tetrasphaera australiensis Ben110]
MSEDPSAEAEAMDRIRAGDASAYAVLVAAHAGIATRLAWLNGAGGEAEDVVQEAFVKAYAALPGFRDGAAFRPWLLRIVINETRNRQRAQERRLRRDDAAARLDARTSFVRDPAETAELHDRHGRLYAAVSALPQVYREVVTCRYLMELSEAETAAALDVAVGTVKSRLHRAMSVLREELADA